MKIKPPVVDLFLTSQGAHEIQMKEGNLSVCLNFELLLAGKMREGWVEWKTADEGTFLIQMGFGVGQLSVEESDLISFIPGISGIEHFQLHNGLLVWVGTGDVARKRLPHALIDLLGMARRNIASVASFFDLTDVDISLGQNIKTQLEFMNPFGGTS